MKFASATQAFHPLKPPKPPKFLTAKDLQVKSRFQRAYRGGRDRLSFNPGPIHPNSLEVSESRCTRKAEGGRYESNLRNWQFSTGKPKEVCPAWPSSKNASEGLTFTREIAAFHRLSPAAAFEIRGNVAGELERVLRQELHLTWRSNIGDASDLGTERGRRQGSVPVGTVAAVDVLVVQDVEHLPPQHQV